MCVGTLFSSYAVMGNRRLTDKFSTITFSFVEKCINACSLTLAIADPTDLIALTRNHFLVLLTLKLPVYHLKFKLNWTNTNKGAPCGIVGSMKYSRPWTIIPCESLRLLKTWKHQLDSWEKNCKNYFETDNFSWFLLFAGRRQIGINFRKHELILLVFP